MTNHRVGNFGLEEVHVGDKIIRYDGTELEQAVGLTNGVASVNESGTVNIQKKNILKATHLFLTGEYEGECQLYSNYSSLTREEKGHLLGCKCPSFFNSLRYRQPDKYQEACRRFVKAMHAVGFLK